MAVAQRPVVLSGLGDKAMSTSLTNKQLRSWLKQSIRNHLLPNLINSAFEVIPLSEEERRSETISSDPFGRFRRKRDDALDIVEIQMASHQDPSFRVFCGRVPKEGIDHQLGMHVAAEDVWTGYLETYYSFYACSVLKWWFSPKRIIRGPNSQQEVDSYVIDLSDHLVGQIESALRGGQLGRNARRVRLRAQ